MLTAFGEPGIINDPAFGLAQIEHGWQRILTNYAQERAIAPGRGRDEVVQRLMPRTDVARIDPGRNRLNALALAGQKQPGEIVTQGLNSISAINLIAQQSEVMLKAFF